MYQKRRILLIMLTLSIFIFCGCTDSVDQEVNKKDMEDLVKKEVVEEIDYFDIALNEKISLANDEILINGEKYKLEDMQDTSKENASKETIKLKKTNLGRQLVVVLPVTSASSLWTYKATDGIYLNKYKIKELDILDGTNSSNISSSLQIYRFDLKFDSFHHEVYFKLIDIDEEGKDFGDKRGNYQLCIDVYDFKWIDIDEK